MKTPTKRIKKVACWIPKLGMEYAEKNYYIEAVFLRRPQIYPELYHEATITYKLPLPYKKK